MTPDELEAERLYRVTERLGHLCEDLDPTPQERRIAQDEADTTVERLKGVETSPAAS